jgi:hypothetical protein
MHYFIVISVNVKAKGSFRKVTVIFFPILERTFRRDFISPILYHHTTFHKLKLGDIVSLSPHYFVFIDWRKLQRGGWRKSVRLIKNKMWDTHRQNMVVP